MSQTELEIHGMTCDACAVHVHEALENRLAPGPRTIAPGAPSKSEMNEALAGTSYRVERAGVGRR